METARWTRPSDAEFDDLDELVRDAVAADPTFAEGVADIAERASVLRCLVARRKKLGLSQRTVAAAMGTTQSAVSDIENGGTDLYLSTLQRYSRAVGARLSIRPLIAGGPGATRVTTSAAVFSIDWARRQTPKPEPGWQRALRDDRTA